MTFMMFIGLVALGGIVVATILLIGNKTPAIIDTSTPELNKFSVATARASVAMASASVQDFTKPGTVAKIISNSRKSRSRRELNLDSELDDYDDEILYADDYYEAETISEAVAEAVSFSVTPSNPIETTQSTYSSPPYNSSPSSYGGAGSDSGGSSFGGDSGGGDSGGGCDCD